eukprot:1392868-Amorphochlora_amoeboformis.AAC.1
MCAHVLVHLPIFINSSGEFWIGADIVCQVDQDSRLWRAFTATRLVARVLSSKFKKRKVYLLGWPGTVLSRCANIALAKKAGYY